MSLKSLIKVSLLLLASVTMFFASCNRDPAVLKQKAMERGDHEFDQGKYPEAVIYYSKALQIDKYYAPAHYKLALCHLKLSSWASAYREFNRTVDLQPDNWPAQ